MLRIVRHIGSLLIFLIIGSISCMPVSNLIKVTGITLNKTSLELAVGEYETLIATITPDNATNKNITWLSSNEKVVTINNSGKVAAISAGNSIITATTLDGEVIANCNVKVFPISVTGITLNKTSLELAVGEYETLIATITPDNATNKNITWLSSNEKVATVDDNGKVIAISKGMATITAATEDGEFTATCDVAANPILVTGITLNKTSLELEPGDKETLIATITPVNATDKNITWSSSNENIAIVDNKGLVTCVSEGSVTITAAIQDGFFSTCDIKIVKYPCLTFESDSLFSIRPYLDSFNTWNGKLYYKNGGKLSEWQEWDRSSAFAALNGDKYILYIRGINNTIITGSYQNKWIISGAKSVSCTGDIRSLLNYKDVENTTMDEECFCNLFRDCTSLTSAPDLPTTTLTKGCYSQMFYGCTSLTSAPALPATTLADSCYSYMFRDCISLVTPPTLPATTLADSCYSYMFRDCTSLVTPPTLPATTLADSCYSDMFYGCKSLTSVPALIANTLTDRCYKNMFYNCSKLYFSFDDGGEYILKHEFRLGEGDATDALSGMFSGTGGGMSAPSAGTPGKIYWTSNEVLYFYKVERLEISEAEINIEAHNGSKISAKCYPEYSNQSVSFISSDPNIVSVDRYGNIIAKNGGMAIITVSAANEISAICNVSVVSENGKYLKFESDKSFTITSSVGKSWNGTLYYREGSADSLWKIWDGRSISAGEELYIRGTNNTRISPSQYQYPSSINNVWVISGNNVSCTGDIRSLLNYKDIENTTMDEECFYRLFYRCKSLISAPELPATTLVRGCYKKMFEDCSSLISAPELPATTLADLCYFYMFSRCTSLTSAPEILPATTLADSCYSGMFYNCISLISPPALPATTLADSCYLGMFHGCKSLASVPFLPATVLTNECYRNMFHGCSELKFSKFYNEDADYINEFKLGNGNGINDAMLDMLLDTGGAFVGTPSSGQTLWTSNEVVYPE